MATGIPLAAGVAKSLPKAARATWIAWKAGFGIPLTLFAALAPVAVKNGVPILSEVFGVEVQHFGSASARKG